MSRWLQGLARLWTRSSATGTQHQLLASASQTERGLSSAPASADGSAHSVARQPSAAPAVVFVLGGPGAGKGTQCERLAALFGFAHVSAGELLRRLVHSGTPAGQELAQIMNDGRIVPSQVTVGLLRQFLLGESRPVCLIDGFPRNLENAHAWHQETGVEPALVLNLTVPESELERRLLLRRRGDDDITTIRKRFETFTRSTLPVLEHYRRKNLVTDIQADGSPDEVFKACQAPFLAGWSASLPRAAAAAR